MSLRDEELQRIVGTAEQVVQMFEAALEILQAAQATIPFAALQK